MAPTTILPSLHRRPFMKPKAGRGAPSLEPSGRTTKPSPVPFPGNIIFCSFPSFPFYASRDSFSFLLRNV